MVPKLDDIGFSSSVTWTWIQEQYLDACLSVCLGKKGKKKEIWGYIEKLF